MTFENQGVPPNGKRPAQNSPSAPSAGDAPHPHTGGDHLSGADNHLGAQPNGRGGGSNDVDEMNRQYSLDPTRGDAAPPNRRNDSLFAEGVDNTRGADDAAPPKRSAAQAIGSFFTPASKKEPKTSAERKRAIEEAKRRQRASVRYKGDRWRLLAGRAAVALMLVLSLVALSVAMSRPSKDDLAKEVTTQLDKGGRNFPVGDSVMWAGQALRVWGTWDEASADNRKVLLAPYLSGGMDDQGGWNEKGKQDVIFASVNPEPDVIDANHAMVDAAYQIGDGTWRCVTIPVFAYKPDQTDANSPWAFALSSNPTPSGCAPRTGAPQNDGKGRDKGLREDSELGDDLGMTFFPGFFGAWAASDQNILAQYTAPGVRTLGLGGAMSSVPAPTIKEAVVYVPDSGPLENVPYQAVVPVTWTLSGSTSEVTSVYTVPIRRNADRWYVTGEPQATTFDPDLAGGSTASVPNPGDEAVPTYPASTTTPSTPPSGENPTTEGG